jgi:uncharacterized protein (TIGR03437 family)
LAATQLVLDTSKLQGGSSTRFRVLASNGLTNASAEVGPINLVQTPVLVAPTATVDLHAAVVTQGIERTFVVSNTGDGPLQINAFVSSASQFRVNLATPAFILAGEKLDIPIQFVPSGAGTVSGTLRIDSNDPSRPSVTVGLAGRGIVSPAPEIAVTPSTLAFGNVQSGKGQTQNLTIVNHGPSPLDLTQLTISGTGFTLATTPVAATLAVDAKLEIPVRFAPKSIGAVAGTVTISSSDPISPQVQVPLTGTGTAGSAAAPPAVTAGGIVSAASFTAPLSRGALGAIFGTNLASGTQTTSTVPWVRLMAGAKVIIAGIEAPLYYVSPTLIDFQVPYEVPLGTVSVVVSRDGFESDPVNVTIAQNAPGIFGYPRTPTAFDPVIVHLDGSLVTPSNPAKPNEVLLAFITGVSEFAIHPPTGDVARVAPLPWALSESQASVGTAFVEILYLGLTPGFIGLGQVNLKMPPSFPVGSTSLPLRLRVGSSDAPQVNLAVAP